MIFFYGMIVQWFLLPLQAEETHWTSARTGTAASGLRITGHVIPQDGALHLESARVQGRVTSLLKREGERVSPGTPLLSISSGECLSLREEKKVALHRSLPELMDAAKKREAQLGILVKGDDCQFISQNAGVITKRTVENGSSFNVGDPIVTILETGKLSVELDLPEQGAPAVRVGQKVSIELASAPGVQLQSTVQTIVPTVDPANRTIKVRLRPIPLPRSVTLDSLAFGRIDTGTQEQILTVPTSAVVFDDNKSWIVKQTKADPMKVEVQVLSETESLTSIRAVDPKLLRSGDLVAGSGAIFFFKR